MAGTLGDESIKPMFFSQLFAAIPFDYAPSIPGDGKLQGARGDTLRMEYDSPSRGRIVVTRQLP
jgi:hypothetical protein